MKRSRWVQLGIIIFIAINLLLVFIDEESRVDRVSYVNSWSNSFTADLKHELYKPVVLAPADEKQIYFDRDRGTFQEFLVAEGDEVTEGTALFTYRVENYYEAESDLHEQINRLNGEIRAIEQAITHIENYNIPANDFDPASSVLITEEDIFVEIPESPLEAEFMKEQYLIEKENELATKELELTAAENQLSELQSTGDMLTVESPYAGIVKHLATDLGDPLIVIESSQLQARGELSEGERTKVEEGMPAVLQLDETDVLLEGAVDSLAHSSSTVEADKESSYPFTASFIEGMEVTGTESGESDNTEENTDAESEEADTDSENVEVTEVEINEETEVETNEEIETELLPGYHGELAITLEESLGATVVFEDALINQHVWRMTPQGKLERQAVETGLYDDHRMEIISGLEAESLVAEGPVHQLREGASFITPIQWRQLNRESFSLRHSDWVKSFVSGLLSR